MLIKFISNGRTIEKRHLSKTLINVFDKKIKKHLDQKPSNYLIIDGINIASHDEAMKFVESSPAKICHLCGEEILAGEGASPRYNTHVLCTSYACAYYDIVKGKKLSERAIINAKSVLVRCDIEKNYDIEKLGRRNFITLMHAKIKAMG